MNQGEAIPILCRVIPYPLTLLGRKVKLDIAQQSVDQSHQLPGSKRHGSFVMMLGSFVVLGLVISLVLRLTHQHGVSSSHQVVPEVGVSCFGKRHLFSSEVARLMGTARQPGEFRQRGVVLKPMNVLNLSQETCRIDRPQPWHTKKAGGYGYSLEVSDDGLVYFLRLAGQSFDSGQGYSQYYPESTVVHLVQTIGIPGGLLESTRHLSRVRETAVTTSGYIGGEYFQVLGSQFIEREFIQHCLAGGTKRVFERGCRPNSEKARNKSPSVYTFSLVIVSDRWHRKRVSRCKGP